MLNNRFIKSFIFSFALILISSALKAQTKTQEIRNINKIMTMSVNSSINPATFNYLESGIIKAKKENVDLVLIKLNTPGGLVSVTKNILTLFGKGQIPIMVWITPEGASATSAGAIIASGAHILVMSDGTNIGAATPVELGKDIKQKDLRSKSINDLVALVKSLAKARNRGPDDFAKMITTAASYTTHDAHKKNLIDGIINKRSEVGPFLNNKKIVIQGQKIILSTGSIEFISYEMDLGQKLLDIFANPSLAYILFLIGAALVYFELQVAGGMIAGGIGAFCLVLAGIGFQVLPLNFGALGLMGLSFILFIMEAYITSYGILAMAGLASLITGSMFLYRTDDGYLSLSMPLIFSSAGAIVAFLAFIMFVIMRDHKNIGKKSFNNHTGKKAIIISTPNSDSDEFIYQVKVSGEIWNAQSKTKHSVGEWVNILEQDNTNNKLNI